MDDAEKSREDLVVERNTLYQQIQDLKESEARFQKEISFLKQKLSHLNIVYEQIPAFFWTTDKNLVFTSSSGRALARLGVKPQNVIGHSLYEYVEPGVHDSLDTLWHARALEGESAHFEYSWSGVIFDVFVDPLRDEKGDITGTVGAAFDITELKKMEEERDAILKISQRLIAPLTLLEFAHILAAESRRLFDHHAFSFFLYMEDRQIMNVVLAEDTPPDGVAPKVMHEQRAVDISYSRIRTLVKSPTLINREEEPSSTEFTPFCFESRLSRSMMIVPIYWKEEMIGSIVVSSYQPNRYSPRDLKILESLTNICGGAVARLRIEESLNMDDRAMESSINAIAFLDLEGRIFYVNRSFLSFWDYDDKEDVLHRPFQELWKDKESAARILGDVLDKGWWNGSLTAVREDDSLFKAEMSATLIPEGAEMPGYIMISLLDVSAKALADKALRVAQFSIENSGDAVFRISSDGHFTYANEAATHLTGYSREELLTMSVWDIDPPYKGDKWTQKWKEIKENNIRIVQSTIKTKDGRWIPVEISRKYLEIGGEEYICGFMRDISERRKAEQELKSAHNLYRNVIHNDRGCPYFCDFIKLTYEIYCSEKELAGIPLEGLTPEQMKKHIKETVVTDPEAASTDPSEYARAFREGSLKRYQADYRIVNPLGVEHWLSDCSLPVYDPDTGKVIGSQGILHDITDRKKAEMERESLQRISRLLLPAMTIYDMGRIMAEEIRRLFRHDAFWFSLYDKHQNMLKRIYVEDTLLGADKPEETSFEETLHLGKKYPIYVEGKPRLINRTEDPAQSDLIPFGDTARISHSLMFVPVMSEGHVIGVISAQSYTPGRYSQRDLNLLQTFADQCGPAVERARLYDALHIKDLAMDSAHSAVVLLDIEGKITYVNHSLLTLCDYDDPGYVIGKSFSKFLENKSEIQRFLHKIQTEESWVGELKIRREDGSLLQVQVSANLIKDRTGKSLCIGVAMQDLSGQMLASEALQLAQYTMENANDLIFWFDSEGNIFYHNDAVSRLLGYTSEELLSMHLSDIDPSRPREILPSKIQLLREKGHAIRESVLRTKDGNLVPIEVSVNYLKYGDKEFICAFARDITERKRAEDTLRMSEEKYRLLVENADAVIVNVNDAGALLNMNKTAFSYLKGNPEDFIGKTLWDFFPRDVADKRIEGIREVIRSGIPVVEDISMLTQGEERWFHVNIVPIRDSQGIIISALVVANDSTSRKHAEEELEESLTELKYMKMIYQAVLRGTPYGLCMLSPEWHVVWANHALKKTLDPENVMPELKGVSFGEFFPSEKNFNQYKKSAIETVRKSGFDTRKLNLQSENGAPLWCEVALVRVDPSQTAPGFVATITPLQEKNNGG